MPSQRPQPTPIRALTLVASLEVPTPSFDHLLRMSDDTGLFEHARGVIPRREHGYCLDDVARGLVVLSRQPDPEPRLVDLATRYLAFVAHSQTSTGHCHNRMGYDRRWQDQAGVDDCWGRAVWGLGSLAAADVAGWMRAEALDRFELSAECRSPWRRATAFASLGAAAVLGAYPDHAGARRLLSDAVAGLGRPADDRLATAEPAKDQPANTRGTSDGSTEEQPGDGQRWPWPEPALTYANATVAEAMISAGAAIGNQAAVNRGLALLTWLFEVQTTGGHLSPVPAGGWALGEKRPAFDQQPIEVCALADAAATALNLTGDRGWAACVKRCVGWFAGDNDTDTPMYDPVTGGGFDGLEADGRNANQGAESTLAALATLQLAQQLGVTSC